VFLRNQQSPIEGLGKGDQTRREGRRKSRPRNMLNNIEKVLRCIPFKSKDSLIGGLRIQD
jgi:hypothetical protein